MYFRTFLHSTGAAKFSFCTCFFIAISIVGTGLNAIPFFVISGKPFLARVTDQSTVTLESTCSRFFTNYAEPNCREKKRIEKIRIPIWFPFHLWKYTYCMVVLADFLGVFWFFFAEEVEGKG